MTRYVFIDSKTPDDRQFRFSIFDNQMAKLKNIIEKQLAKH